MPYALRKAPKRDAYWVINKETGTKHSNDPLPKDKAEAQMRALYANETKGGGRESGIPLGVLQVITRAAYSGRTPLKFAGFELIRSSPTLKFYKKGDLIVVSVRGTDPRDPRDVDADIKSVVGKVRQSQRVEDDLAMLRSVQSEYPKSKYRYTGVGHSLGGAILDVFLRDGLLHNALSYNPMIEPQERRQRNLRHRRIYNEEDPLYLMFGRNVPNVEVRKSNDPLWKIWLTYKLPPIIKQLFVLWDKHRLQSFKGGANTLADVITDIYPVRPMDEMEDIYEEREFPRIVRRVVGTRKTGRKIDNPAYVALPADVKRRKFVDPPLGVKGVKQKIDEVEDVMGDVVEGTEIRNVKVGERPVNARTLEEVDAVERDLRGLAHFYSFRDPATALGFRVLADEVKNAMPLYEGRRRKVNDAGHDESQHFSGMMIMGRNPTAAAKGFQQPNPTIRYNAEVVPLFPETEPPRLTAEDNPLRTARRKVNRKGEVIYNIPPSNNKQREMLLQDYPQVKGRTMYLDANK